MAAFHFHTHCILGVASVSWFLHQPLFLPLYFKELISPLHLLNAALGPSEKECSIYLSPERCETKNMPRDLIMIEVACFHSYIQN
jgi:hypothetical protein